MFLKHVHYFNTRYNPHNKKTTNYYQDTIKYLKTGITDLIIDIVNFFHQFSMCDMLSKSNLNVLPRNKQCTCNNIWSWEDGEEK